MKYLYLMLFSFYQRLISPYKGFTCAHRHINGGVGCSKAVLDILSEKGFLKGKSDIITRLEDCTDAFNHVDKRDPIDERKKKKDGTCDLAFDVIEDCDLPVKKCIPDLDCDICGALSITKILKKIPF